jgi:hypothetical protein
MFLQNLKFSLCWDHGMEELAVLHGGLKGKIKKCSIIGSWLQEEMYLRMERR